MDAPSLFPRDDVSQYERSADLLKLMDYLNDGSSQELIPCLFTDEDGNCHNSNSWRYTKWHPGKFGKSAKILTRESRSVKKEDFSAVVRYYFCGNHDFTPTSGRKHWRLHFEKLWEEAPEMLRAEVWDALQKSERSVYLRAPSTPRKHRPGLDRAVNSAPKETLNPSGDDAGSIPDPGAETPSRPQTAQAKFEPGSTTFSFNDTIKIGHKFQNIRKSTETPSPESPFGPSSVPRYSSTLSKLTAERKDLEIKPPTIKSEGPLLTHEKKMDVGQAPLWWPSRDVDLQLDMGTLGKPPEMTFTPYTGYSIFDSLRRGGNHVDPLRSVKSGEATPGLASPSRNSKESDTKTSTSGIDTRRSPTLHSSPEKPTTRAPSPRTLSPESFYLSRTSMPTATRTSTPNADTPGTQPPIMSRETPIKHESSPTSQNDTANLESLAAKFNDLEFSNPPPRRRLFQEEPRSTSPQTPQAIPEDSCIYTPRNPTATAREIKKILKEDLTGHIYVFEAPEFFSKFKPALERSETWVKIGIASDVEQRRKALASKCGFRDLTEVYASDTMRMDVLRVIEAVCHEQLNNWRRKMDCARYGRGSKCKTLHKEWFHVDKDRAVKTVQMWTGFLDNNPYGHGGVLEDRWRKSLFDRKKYRLLETPRNELDQAELLHQSLEAWIGKTMEEGKSEE